MPENTSSTHTGFNVAGYRAFLVEQLAAAEDLADRFLNQPNRTSLVPNVHFDGVAEGFRLALGYLDEVSS